jgi:phosphopantothenoylcysteine decarboxylase/phosphopantothenate--cysteine ligase
MLSGKKILIGITGSIAAYKIITLVRLLVKQGAEVKLIMTPAARDFVSPLVLATLSKNKVVMDLAEGDEWSNHVMLGRWADLMLIAPLSCNTLAKMANGQCDNLLLAVYLSATCPVAVAPAMDEDMWKHPATKRNLRQLAADGVHVLNVGNGELASGLSGEGRMAEPEEIIQYLTEHFFRTNELMGKKVLITAGPTYEAIDPVRFIGNHSSGKMGYALAEACYLRGAEVTLVSGPTALTPAYSGIRLVHVQTAAEMLEACTVVFTEMDIAIMSAAVADYTPVEKVGNKIKKKEAELVLTLTKTADILKTLCLAKQPGQYVMGFALETEHENENAKEKLVSKNADAIVLNSLRDAGAGFAVDTNTVTIFSRSGKELHLETAPKTTIAHQIVSFLIEDMHA